MELETIKTDVETYENGQIDRNQILNFEKALSEQPNAMFGDNDLMPLKHSFAPGIYIREIFIPKGSILTGKIHRHAHPNILMKGEVIVITEFGGREHLKAPMSMISKEGTKRAVYAIQDTVWITIHLNPTDTKNLQEIEEYVIAPSYEDLRLPYFETKATKLNGFELKNCLILALKELNRDFSCLTNLKMVVNEKGILLPFKESLKRLKEAGISVSDIFASKDCDGVWHVDTKKGISLECFGTDVGQTINLEDSELVGTWAAVAIGGSAVVAGGTSYLSGKGQANAAENAANIQLQATRDSIAAQQQGADKAFGIYQSEAAKSRDFLTTQYDLARSDLQPLRDFGLQALQNVQQYTDPNSQLSAQERLAFGKTLGANLSARGLTGSGAEIAGLSNFELGLAGQRRDLALNLAGVGSGAIQNYANLDIGLGQGLAGISQNLGNLGGSIYGNLGQSIGNTFSQGGVGSANSILAGGQANANTLIGIGNAAQTGILGFGQLQSQQAQQQQSQQNFNSILSLIGGNSSSTPYQGGYMSNMGYNTPFN